MGIQYSVDVNNACLDAVETTIGTAPTLELWNGTKPANCATADTGTKVATGVLPSDWLSNAASFVKSKSGTWQATGTVAAGTGTNVQYLRVTVAGVCKMQMSVSGTGLGGDAEMDNPNVANGQIGTVSLFSISRSGNS